MMEWQKEVVWLDGEIQANVSWGEGIPKCTKEECLLYDGKRCRALGMRPGVICEPVVAEMARVLSKAEFDGWSKR